MKSFLHIVMSIALLCFQGADAGPVRKGARSNITSAAAAPVTAGAQAVVTDSKVVGGAVVTGGKAVGEGAKIAGSAATDAADAAMTQIVEKGAVGAATDAAAATQDAVQVVVKAVKDGEVQKFQANAQKAGVSFEGKTIDGTDVPVIGEIVREMGPLESVFESIKISGIKATQPDLTELALSGVASVFGASAKVSVNYDVLKKGAYLTIAPQQFKISNLVEALKPVDELLAFKDVQLILASKEIKALGLKPYKEGTNFAATLIVQGPMKEAIGTDITAKVKGLLPNKPGLMGLRIVAKIPTEFDLGAGLQIKESTLGLELKGDGPAITIGSGITFPMPMQEPITVRAEITFDTAPTGGLSVQGLVEGDWKNAFGIPFLTIKNAGLQAKKAYASNTPITEFAIKGDVALGKKKIDLVVQVKAPPAKKKTVSVIGSFQGGLGLADIIDIASAITGESIPATALPNLNLKDASLQVVTDENGATIFWKKYPRGVYITGEAALFGKHIKLVFMLDPKKGIIAEGYIEKIDLGILKLTGDGADKKVGTPDDGAIIDIQLTKEKQKIFVSGLVELNLPAFGGVFSQVLQMDVDKTGATFMMNQEVFGVGMTFEGTLPLADINQAMLKIKGTQAALDKVKDAFNSNIDFAKKGAQEAAQAANAALDAANKKFNDAKKLVDDAESKLTPFSNLEKQARDKQDACDRLKDAAKAAAEAAARAAKEAAEAAARAAQKAAEETARAAQDAAQATQRSMQQAAAGVESAGKAVGGAAGDLANAVGGALGKVKNFFTGGDSKPRIPNPYEWMEDVPHNPRVVYGDTGRAARDRRVPGHSMATVLSTERDHAAWIALGYDKNLANLAYAIKAGFPVQNLELIMSFLVGSITNFGPADQATTQRAMQTFEEAKKFADQVGNADAKAFLISLQQRYQAAQTAHQQKIAADKAAADRRAVEAQNNKQVAQKVQKNLGGYQKSIADALKKMK